MERLSVMNNGTLAIDFNTFNEFYWMLGSVENEKTTMNISALIISSGTVSKFVNVVMFWLRIYLLSFKSESYRSRNWWDV